MTWDGAFAERASQESSPILVPPVCTDPEDRREGEGKDTAEMSDSSVVKTKALQRLESLQGMEAGELVGAMADWVHAIKPWQCVSHLTFKWEASQDSTRRNFEKFMRMKLPDVDYFYAIERNPSRDGNHVHALWHRPMTLSRKGAWSEWFAAYGRARIEPVKSQEDVTSYVAKYVTKESAWWNVKLIGPPGCVTESGLVL